MGIDKKREGVTGLQSVVLVVGVGVAGVVGFQGFGSSMAELVGERVSAEPIAIGSGSYAGSGQAPKYEADMHEAYLLCDSTSDCGDGQACRGGRCEGVEYEADMHELGVVTPEEEYEGSIGEFPDFDDCNRMRLLAATSGSRGGFMGSGCNIDPGFARTPPASLFPPMPMPQMTPPPFPFERLAEMLREDREGRAEREAMMAELVDALMGENPQDVADAFMELLGDTRGLSSKEIEQLALTLLSELRASGYDYDNARDNDWALVNVLEAVVLAGHDPRLALAIAANAGELDDAVGHDARGGLRALRDADELAKSLHMLAICESSGAYGCARVLSNRAGKAGSLYIPPAHRSAAEMARAIESALQSYLPGHEAREALHPISDGRLAEAPSPSWLDRIFGRDSAWEKDTQAFLEEAGVWDPAIKETLAIHSNDGRSVVPALKDLARTSRLPMHRIVEEIRINPEFRRAVEVHLSDNGHFDLARLVQDMEKHADYYSDELLSAVRSNHRS